MVLDSICKKVMIILILAVITYGCKDSLGIEPNPKITYIDKPPYKNTKYAIKNIYLTINEKYNFIETYNWDTNYIPIAYDLFIDTVSQVPFMWFNFKLKSLKMTPGFPRRNDWVSEVEFRADSINPIGTILLTEPKYKTAGIIFRYSYIPANNIIIIQKIKHQQ